MNFLAAKCKLKYLLFFLKKFRKELYIHLFCLIIIFSTYSWKWYRLTEKKIIWFKLFWLIENRIWMILNIIQVVNERRRRYAVPKSKKGTYKDLIGHGGSVIDRKVYARYNYNDVIFVTYFSYNRDTKEFWDEMNNATSSDSANS